jgi:hypothetical protein
MMPPIHALSALAATTLCNSFFACPQPVRDETRSGGLHFNDVVQPTTVDGLPFAGVGESGCTLRPPITRIIQAAALMLILMTDDNPLADGCQGLKYSYDEFTYLRSSVDIPLA